MIAKKNVWAWPFGIFSCFLLIIVSQKQDLPIQAVVQSINVILGIWGWFQWNSAIPILRNYSQLKNVLGFFLCLVLACAFNLLMFIFYSNEKIEMTTFLDAFILMFSLFATVLTIKGFKENWYYWLLVNLLTFILTFSGGLYYFAGLSFVYFIFSVYGLYQWQQNESKNI